MGSLENINELVNSSLKKPLGKKRLNLQLEVNKCLANLSAQINYHDIRLKLDIDDNADVHMTPAYLDSILLNVLSNAIKYRKTSEASEITIRTIPNKDFTPLLVEDNGKGMETHAVQLKKGMGLHSITTRVKHLKGHCTIDTTPGKGTTVIIEVPI